MKITFKSDSIIILADVWVEGPQGKRGIKMAIDTGSTYTIIPAAIAEAVGCNLKRSKNFVTLVTASGVEKAPVVKVKLQIWGKEIENIKVAAHDLPAQSYVDGLLGIDALRLLKAVIDFKHSTIEL